MFCFLPLLFFFRNCPPPRKLLEPTTKLNRASAFQPLLESCSCQRSFEAAVSANLLFSPAPLFQSELAVPLVLPQLDLVGAPLYWPPEPKHREYSVVDVVLSQPLLDSATPGCLAAGESPPTTVFTTPWHRP
ncbi:hypothetical protein MRX96_044130 [Rhipicephalus microplus]